MKKIIIILLMLFTLNAFATGKIQVQPNYFVVAQKIRPMIGLSIYERLHNKWFYNGWYGYGDQAFGDRPDVGWYSLRNAFDYQYGAKSTLSFGVQSIILEGESDFDNRVFVRASYQIW